MKLTQFLDVVIYPIQVLYFIMYEVTEQHILSLMLSFSYRLKDIGLRTATSAYSPDEKWLSIVRDLGHLKRSPLSPILRDL